MRILLVLSALLGMAASAIAQEYKAPRGADGIHPDLNGIWQALSSAHYDIEMHTASHSLQLREGPHGPLPSVKTLYLGAVGAVPPGMGVVVGGKIPYTEEGLAKKLENKANWLDRDPEIKCYLPGIPRATYMPQPFQIFQNADSSLWPISTQGPCERCIWMTRRSAGGQLDGMVCRSLGRRYAGR